MGFQFHAFFLWLLHRNWGARKLELIMKKFFRLGLSWCAMARRVCMEWIGSLLNGPEVYREGWERPDPDEVK